MDGACPTCGKSVFGDVKDVFDNGPVPPKQGVSSAGRLNRSDYRTRSAPPASTSTDEWVRYADDLIARSRSRRPERGPLRPVNTPAGPTDWSWLENSITTVSQAEDLFELTRADAENAVMRAEAAKFFIDHRRMAERELDPAERHEFAQHLAAITHANRCWDVHVRVRARYYKLLDATAEAEQMSRSGSLGRGFEDPLSPYRDPKRDDGSLAFAQRQHERAERDRRQGPARNFDTTGMYWE
jgi:hypothetical protein